MDNRLEWIVDEITKEEWKYEQQSTKLVNRARLRSVVEGLKEKDLNEVEEWLSHESECAERCDDPHRANIERGIVRFKRLGVKALERWQGEVINQEVTAA